MRKSIFLVHCPPLKSEVAQAEQGFFISEVLLIHREGSVKCSPFQWKIKTDVGQVALGFHFALVYQVFLHSNAINS